MANTKLLKVMDYLINEQTDKAQELLHQIFIEKARAIHEEMIQDDEHDEETMLGGDQGEDLAHDIESDMDEIDAEEYGTMEDEDEDLNVSDAEEDLTGELEDMDDADMDDADVDMHMDADMDTDTDTEVTVDDDAEAPESEQEQIHDLEQAIAELKAEFEALKHDAQGAHDDHMDTDSEDKMAESWEDDTDDLSEEDYEGLDEATDLDTVQAAKKGEVGSGRYAPAETNTHSPVPASQGEHMGARPVKTGQGTKASGYDRQSAPESKSMNLSNRRKDAEDGKRPVTQQGDASALLNKGTSAGFGTVNVKSPISGRK
jgi:hypothetical protein